MSYVANLMKAKSLMGKSVGDGQCIAFVHAVTTIPPPPFWRKGERVKEANLPIGTIIATFDVNGRYGNHLDGSSHGAIYLGQNAHGILVLDQWKGHSTTQPVHERLIRFKKGTGIKVDDGDQYYVVD